MEKEKVLNLLLKNGFINDGKTEAETVTYITTNSYPFSGAVATYGNRQRLRRGEQKVTVGKRTVNFYKVKNCKPVEFHNFRTSDFEHIENFVKSLAELESEFHRPEKQIETREA